MSRDYKSKTNSSPAARRGGSMFAGILIGLILGLGIALGVAWYINKMPSPFLNRRSASAEKQPIAPPAPQAAIPQPPDEKTVEKPRFDFYKILPGQDGPVTNNKPAPPAPAAPAVEATSDSYYLQAGSFQKKSDADNMKAKLAMLGMESDIQSTTGSGNESRYRVRIGPYQTQIDLKKIQDDLQQNGITASIIKIKETSQ